MEKLKRFFGTECKFEMAKKTYNILQNAIIGTYHSEHCNEIVTYIDGEKDKVIFRSVSDKSLNDHRKFTTPGHRYRVSLIVPDTKVTEYIGIMDRETGKCIAYSPEHPVSQVEQDAWDEILRTVYAFWAKHTVKY